MLVDLLGGWTEEGSRGVGPAAQPLCAIPECLQPTDGRGLCRSCARAFYRGGVVGLKERARRVRKGRIQVGSRGRKPPIYYIRLMEQAIVQLAEADAEDDEEYIGQLFRLVKLGIYVGRNVRDAKKLDALMYRWKYERMHGKEAFLRLQRERAQRYRMKQMKKARGPA